MKPLLLMAISALLCTSCYTEDNQFFELTGERTYIPYKYKISWEVDKPFDGDPRIIEVADEYVKKYEKEKKYFLSDKIIRIVFDKGNYWMAVYTHENSLLIHGFSLIIKLRKSDLVVVYSGYMGRSDIRGPID